jgi:1,4-alpha-glucan branching enzyme
MNAKQYDDRPGQSTTTQNAPNGQKNRAEKSKNPAPQTKTGRSPSSDNGQPKLLRDESAQRQIVFQLGAPAARNVSLAAEFTSWDKQPIAMSRGASGIWQTTVTLAQGRHRYKFLVDGEWQDDPNCANRVPNPFGTTDALIEVR